MGRIMISQKNKYTNYSRSLASNTTSWFPMISLEFFKEVFQ